MCTNPAVGASRLVGYNLACLEPNNTASFLKRSVHDHASLFTIADPGVYTPYAAPWPLFCGFIEPQAWPDAARFAQGIWKRGFCPRAGHPSCLVLTSACHFLLALRVLPVDIQAWQPQRRLAPVVDLLIQPSELADGGYVPRHLFGRSFILQHSLSVHRNYKLLSMK